MLDIIELRSIEGDKVEFPLEIQRNVGRRTMLMRLKYPNIISISAPMRVSKTEILNFVNDNSKWIFSALKNLKKPLKLLEYLKENPQLFTRGLALKISFLNSISKNGYWIEDLSKNEILFAFPEGDDNAFKNLFLRYAKESIEKTIFFVAKNKNLEVPKISIRDQRSRWASRSSSGLMSFNWRLILLPSQFQEYIILHEFAHEKFMDHSVSFWIYLNRLIEGAKRLDKLVSKEGAKVFSIDR